MSETKKQILLVEDDNNDAELTIKALKESNIANQIIRVEDGEEAINYLKCEGKYQSRQNLHPALILLDLKLPKINGLEVLKTIRGNAALKYIPVVVLTSSREEQDLIRSYELGVNAYVVKPVDFQKFALAIKELGIFWLVINIPPPEK